MQLLKDCWLLRNEDMDEWGVLFLLKDRKRQRGAACLMGTCTDSSASPLPWMAALPPQPCRTQNCPLRTDTVKLPCQGGKANLEASLAAAWAVLGDGGGLGGKGGREVPNFNCSLLLCALDTGARDIVSDGPEKVSSSVYLWLFGLFCL